MKEQSDISDHVLGARLRDALEGSRVSFSVSEGYFESREVLIASKAHSALSTPEGYFEEKQVALLNEIKHRKVEAPNRMVRLWLPIAAAAMIVGFALLFWTEKQESVSFAQQLEQSPIEFEDLEVIDFDPSVYEEFVEDEDTVIADTTQLKKVPQNVSDFKPSKGQSIITWEDLDAEDIEQYLKEEESLNIIDEL